MSTKWTPGTWLAEISRMSPEDEVRGFRIRVDGKLPSLASAAVYEHHVLTVPKDFRLAQPDAFREYFDPSEVEANAHLIAAAPELYAALEELVSLTDRKHNAWDNARAALAKARSETERSVPA